MSIYTDNLPDLSRGFCVIDLETSGLDPERDRIIEVAVVVSKNGAIQDSFSLLVNSVDEVPEEVTNLTGITTSMVRNLGTPPALALRSLLYRPDLQAYPVVGHNILKFERAFLGAECKRAWEGKWNWKNRVMIARAANVLDPAKMIDTGGLFKGIGLGIEPMRGEPHWKWAGRVLDEKVKGLYWNLSAAALAYGIDLSQYQTHRAGEDVRLCHDLFLKILEKEGAAL